ncbi:MAG: hypothetical protein V7746_01605 [Halioglobus sp.]
MIIATLLALLFFGGSGSAVMTDGIEHLHDSIKSELSKGSARDKALDVVKTMKGITKDYGKADGKQEKTLIDLLENHDSSATDLQNHIAEANERRVEYQRHMLDLRSDLKRTLTINEWNKVFAMDKAK